MDPSIKLMSYAYIIILALIACTANASSVGETAASKNVSMYFFWQIGCSHCEELAPFMSDLEKKYSELDLKRVEVGKSKEGSDLFDEMAKAYGKSAKVTPTVFVGKLMIEGYNGWITEGRIESALVNCTQMECASPEQVLDVYRNGQTTLTTAITTSSTSSTTTSTTSTSTMPKYGYYDNFTYEDPLWSWDYKQGQGYHICPQNDGQYSPVLECGVWANATSVEYSDSSLHEAQDIHNGSDMVEYSLRVNVAAVTGTWGAGLWNHGIGANGSDFTGIYAIWFMYSGNQSYSGWQGMRAQVLYHSREPVYNQLITGYDLNGYHIYRVERYNNAIRFLIDNTSVAAYIWNPPGEILRSEIWLDNAIVHQDGSRTYSNIHGTERLFARYISHSRTITPDYTTTSTTTTTITTVQPGNGLPKTEKKDDLSIFIGALISALILSILLIRRQRKKAMI